MKKASKYSTIKTLDLSKIDDIAIGDESYRQELIGLSLNFFRDLKINFKKYLSQLDEVKFHYMVHKAQATLALFNTEAIQELLQISKQSITKKPVDVNLIQQSIEDMDNLCDFFIINLQNCLD